MSRCHAVIVAVMAIAIGATALASTDSVAIPATVPAVRPV